MKSHLTAVMPNIHVAQNTMCLTAADVGGHCIFDTVHTSIQMYFIYLYIYYIDLYIGSQQTITVKEGYLNIESVSMYSKCLSIKSIFLVCFGFWHQEKTIKSRFTGHETKMTC